MHYGWLFSSSQQRTEILNGKLIEQGMTQHGNRTTATTPEWRAAPSTITTAEAWLDINTCEFWGDGFSKILDEHVCHPNAPSTHTVSLTSQYSKHECSKRGQYEQRAPELEGASFVPLVLSTIGGIGPACKTFT